jgi:hypothetical protein
LPETMTKWWLIFILFGFLVVVGVTGVWPSTIKKKKEREKVVWYHLAAQS